MCFTWTSKFHVLPYISIIKSKQPIKNSYYLKFYSVEVLFILENILKNPCVYIRLRLIVIIKLLFAKSKTVLQWYYRQKNLFYTKAGSQRDLYPTYRWNKYIIFLFESITWKFCRIRSKIIHICFSDKFDGYFVTIQLCELCIIIQHCHWEKTTYQTYISFLSF